MRDSILGDGLLFQPDALLPSQYFETLKKRVPSEPEYRLVLAVLQDAIECFQKPVRARDRKARERFEDAAAWLASDDRKWPYSFINICELLCLDPAYIRRGLTAWQEAQAPLRSCATVLALKPEAETGLDDEPDLTAKAS